MTGEKLGLARSGLLGKQAGCHGSSRARSRRKQMSKISILAELWQFMKVRKKWWLGPVLFILILLSLLIVFAEGSALAPFIYALF